MLIAICSIILNPYNKVNVVNKQIKRKAVSILLTIQTPIYILPEIIELIDPVDNRSVKTI
jgi:hypothetical protein